jgi:hypothetical protein
MTERIETLEQQLAESEAAATEARHRASEAEESYGADRRANDDCTLMRRDDRRGRSVG